MRKKNFLLKLHFLSQLTKVRDKHLIELEYLPNYFFFHCQLYVAMSRIGSKNSLKSWHPSKITMTQEIFL